MAIIVGKKISQNRIKIRRMLENNGVKGGYKEEDVRNPISIWYSELARVTTLNIYTPNNIG